MTNHFERKLEWTNGIYAFGNHPFSPLYGPGGSAITEPHPLRDAFGLTHSHGNSDRFRAEFTAEFTVHSSTRESHSPANDYPFLGGREAGST